MDDALRILMNCTLFERALQFVSITQMLSFPMLVQWNFVENRQQQQQQKNEWMNERGAAFNMCYWNDICCEYTNNFDDIIKS